MEKTKRTNRERSRELGFGNRSFGQSNRYLNHDGSFNVLRKGIPRFNPDDIYHKLISLSWTKFILLALTFYFVVNLLFAFIYVGIGIDHLAGIKEKATSFEQFSEAFFFSAQSLTTVGYGRISPLQFDASLVAAIESMLGVLSFALITGLLYGRFSRPVARIMYSENAVIAPYREGSGLMLRMANRRSAQLLEAEVEVAVTMKNDAGNGRLFLLLDLELSKINFFPLSWTIVHPLDEKSPLYGMTESDFKERDVEFMLLFKAFDESFSQMVYSRTSYKHEEVVWNAKFISIIGTDNESGMATLQMDRINAYEMVK